MRFRRYFLPNSIVFITQNVYRRQRVFDDEEWMQLLRETLHTSKKLYPFTMLAYVFLPDHFHLLIKPSVGVTFSQIMHSLKPNFTKAYKRRLQITGSMKFWQKRYWDHLIRDEMDFQHHVDYIHYNPVKHGLVAKPEDWPYSSYCYWVERGFYPQGWGWSLPESLTHFAIKYDNRTDSEETSS